jgi:tRNA(Ile)-lysidine synthase
MPKSLRSRALEAFLKESGVKEPEDVHIALAESLVFSDKPSAKASFPGGVTIARNYDRLEALELETVPEEILLSCPGEAELPGLRIVCAPASEPVNTPEAVTVCPVGQIRIRCRKSGDSIRLSGGSKSLKKLFIDRKIPAARRQQIPVVCDDAGILGVYSIGANLDRTAEAENAVTIRFQNTENKGE